MSQASALLEQAWIERWNQRIEPAMELLAQIQASEGWEDLSAEHLSDSLTGSENYLEALLLKSSLLRAQGYRQKSSALLQKTQRVWTESHRAQPFRLLFELGLDHWIDQDLSQALEYFLLARKKAKNLLQEVYSLSNVLWCLEALDLERQETENQLLLIIKKLSKNKKAFAQNVIDQWEAYVLRRDFYQKMVIAKGSYRGQGDFFQKWMELLPYMNQKNALDLSTEYLWQGSYRMRTLIRMWIPADQKSVRVSDAIERLYLWTWLAMAGRPEMTSEKIMFTLESVLSDIEIENQGKDNLLLLRNALGWLQVLYPPVKLKVEKLYRRLSQLKTDNYPVLEAEFDLLLRLTESDLTSRDKCLFEKFSAFKKIYKDMRSNLPFLQEKLTPIMSQYRDYDVIIDISRGEILLSKLGRIVTSKALSYLLSVLCEKGDLNANEISSFDVSNLIYRARKILGPKAIRFRSGVVSRGPMWPKALVLNDIELSAYQIETARSSLSQSDAHYQAARALFPNSFKRKELEKKFSISKASVNRMLEQWLNDGKVTREGQAKAIQYYWSQV